ncbi:MAG: phenylacetate--CoA ligase family protein [Tissierellia bacterium]|nr:phenylacetate--CoA ligase family protein [Tissierellia bacterium]
MSVVNKMLKYYTQIPLWLTNLVAPFYYLLPENIRYGPVYRSEMKELKRIECLPVDEIDAERRAALKRLIAYAYEHVLYYRELFNSIGLSPAEIQDENDLSKIPFLTKELLIKNRDKLISDEFDKSLLIYLTTSGSTGEPTGFYVQKESPMREWVYVLHMFREFDYGPKSSKLVMRGKIFWAQRVRNQNWQWDAFKRELSINIFDMTPENMEQYCSAIEKYKPDIAFGYMSAMYTLCKYIKSRHGGLRHQFKGFMGISETILPEQREFVENTINARVFSFYGMSERVIIAGECKNSTEYHIEPLYGIAELVDSKGKVITQPGVDGELVGTSLLNYAMPLIRYKTGDISCWSERENCECGCGKKRLKYILGRKKNDVLINCDGGVISMASLEIHSKIYDYMARYQFLQETPGIVIIKAVPLPNLKLNRQMLEEIVEMFTSRVMGKIYFTIEIVEMIPPKSNGKLSIIDQRLDVSKYL